MLRSIMAATALSALAIGVQAKTVVINQSIDATTLGNSTAPGFGQTPYSLAVGDTLEVNLSFLPGQAFRIVDPVHVGMIAGAVDTSTAVDVMQHNSLSFVGLQGNAQNPADKSNHTSGYGLMVVFYPAEFLNGASGTISFTGLHITTTILSYSDGAASHDYSWISPIAGGASVAAISAVPEPAGNWLAALGLAAVGLAVRRGTR